jgi:hypothetical protein
LIQGNLLLLVTGSSTNVFRGMNAILLSRNAIPSERLGSDGSSEPSPNRVPSGPRQTHRFSFEWNAGHLDQPVEHTKPVVVRTPLVENKTAGGDDTNRRLRHYAAAQSSVSS